MLGVRFNVNRLRGCKVYANSSSERFCGYEVKIKWKDVEGLITFFYKGIYFE